MRHSRWFVLVACSAAMLFASSAVRAGGGGTIEGGTISFVGAIVEPTCNVASMPNELNQLVNAPAHRALQRDCAAQATSGATTTASRPYDMNVVQLSNSEPDRVLKYFATYVREAQPDSANPMLVTQTYE